MENEVDAGTVDCGATGWRGIDAGGNLKETGFTHWNSPNTGATNSSGFTALPSGNYVPNVSFLHFGNYSTFWSSNESGSNAWFHEIFFSSAQVIRLNYGNKYYGYIVRCLQD